MGESRGWWRRSSSSGVPIRTKSVLLCPVPGSSSTPSRPTANSSNLSSAATRACVISENHIWQNGRKSACTGLFSKTQLKWGIGLENEPLCSLLNSEHFLPSHTHCALPQGSAGLGCRQMPGRGAPALVTKSWGISTKSHPPL